jgi:hypothetical protein
MAHHRALCSEVPAKKVNRNNFDCRLFSVFLETGIHTWSLFSILYLSDAFHGTERERWWKDIPTTLQSGDVIGDTGHLFYESPGHHIFHLSFLPPYLDYSIEVSSIAPGNPNLHGLMLPIGDPTQGL